MSFSNRLIHWYLQNDRDLPWRKSKNPYFIWLSEIRPQPTRGSQGLAYYLTSTKEFPTVFDLAKAPETKVLKLWQGLGYYSRARNLHYSAKYIVNELDGVFPTNYKELLKLKGVGDYTASAISSICFNEVQAVVDGNVYRVLSRYFNIDTPINSSKGIKEFKELAQSLIDPSLPGNHNQAVMDFGALCCKPQKPLCATCVLNDSCGALQKNRVQVLPIKEKKIKIKKRYFNFLVIRSENGKTVLSQRKGKGIWEGLYEFPLMETEKSFELTVNSPELNKWINNPIELTLFNTKEIVHKLSHQHLYTKFWIIDVKNVSVDTVNWSDLEKYPVPILIANFLKNFNST